MFHQAARAKQTALRYMMLGWKDFNEKEPRGERYLAIALRIDNDSNAPRRVNLWQFRLRTLGDRHCRCVAAMPEKAAHNRERRFVIEPGNFARVTLAFMVPEVSKRFYLGFPRDTNATSCEQRQLSMS